MSTSSFNISLVTFQGSFIMRLCICDNVIVIALNFTHVGNTLTICLFSCVCVCVFFFLSLSHKVEALRLVIISYPHTKLNELGHRFYDRPHWPSRDSFCRWQASENKYSLHCTKLSKFLRFKAVNELVSPALKSRCLPVTLLLPTHVML